MAVDMPLHPLTVIGEGVLDPAGLPLSRHSLAGDPGVATPRDPVWTHRGGLTLPEQMRQATHKPAIRVYPRGCLIAGEGHAI